MASSNRTEDPLADIPTLTTQHTSPSDTAARIAALRLVTDSVAQQRQAANSALLFHPYNLAAAALVLAAVAQLLRAKLHLDWLGVGLSSMGVLMTGMAIIRMVTQGYIARAESYGLDWLDGGGADAAGGGGGGKEKKKLQPADVWVTRFGDEVIGAIVVDWRADARTGEAQGRIKGWAVRLRYRGRGVGAALLEEVVRAARARGLRGEEEAVVFAEDHASESFLPLFPLSLSLFPSLPCFLFQKKEKMNEWMDERKGEQPADLTRVFLFSLPQQIPSASSPRSTTNRWTTASSPTAGPWPVCCWRGTAPRPGPRRAPRRPKGRNRPRRGDGRCSAGEKQYVAEMEMAFVRGFPFISFRFFLLVSFLHWTGWDGWGIFPRR
jgi:GNAT superfamily N-acetyltransferase